MFQTTKESSSVIGYHLFMFSFFTDFQDQKDEIGKPFPTDRVDEYAE